MPRNVYVLSLWSWNDFIPVLWPSAKTYYERHGKRVGEYHWVNPACEVYRDLDRMQDSIRACPPDIFGVSLYVWNYEQTLELCHWVKQQWPHCLVITGGPHQYFKHHQNWFLKHNFIDASLPSEVYGEIALADILDNLRDDNTVDWNCVEQMRYPSRDRSMILQSPKATYKRDFQWNYSAFASQRSELDFYVQHFRQHSDRPLHCKIETTRGCPYECTFCDWGGGVGTKVIVKDMDAVIQDIDTLLEYDLSSVYICDANFGINGDRDVAIVQYFADRKRDSSGRFPYVQYGGFAKTNRHFDYLKQIFTIEAKNNMSHVYKISQQTFDHEILDNIKRTDLRSNEHWDLARYLRDNYAYDASVELIMGLPGMTIDKWYREFDKPFAEKVVVRAYPWYLLPEAEAYDPLYREKFKLGVSRKKTNSSDWIMPSEMVVESFSYSREDYRSMMVAYSLYITFIQSGIYKDSINHLLHRGTPFSDFLKRFHREVYSAMVDRGTDSLKHYEQHLDQYVSEEINPIEIELCWNQNPDIELIVWNYIIAEIFYNFELYAPMIDSWFRDQGVPASLVAMDSLMVVSRKRLGTSTWRSWYQIRYDNFSGIPELVKDLDSSCFFVYGKILRANKRLLWF
jgi:putative methyltransferase